MHEPIASPGKNEAIITVGGQGADIGGFTSSAIQIAVDAIKARGGGTVRLSGGIFEISAPIRLCDGILLAGDRERTVLRKTDGFRSGIAEDADYNELKAVVEDASGFLPGMGIYLYDSQCRKNWAVTCAVITAIHGNTLYFDRFLNGYYLPERDGFVTSACSIIEGINIRNARISGMTIDGNKGRNEFIDGCRGSGVYLFQSKHCAVEDVRINDFNGDGLGFHTTEDTVIRNCEVSGCTQMGLHPGAGSVRPLVEGCESHDNSRDGLYVCWGVQQGVFRNNQFRNNGQSGVSIGHKDTHNLFEKNVISENLRYGIEMRAEPEKNAPHANVYRDNVIEDDGGAEGYGYGVFIDTPARDAVFEGNAFRDTGGMRQRA